MNKELLRIQAAVLAYEIVQYYNRRAGPSITCAPGLVPWRGPCFFGGVLFAASYGIAWLIVKEEKKLLP